MIGRHLRQAFGHAALGAMLAGDDVARLHEALVVTRSDAVFRHADEGVDVELVVGEDHEVLEMRRIGRSEEHTSELQSLMRISYAVFCLKKKKRNRSKTTTYHRKIQRVNQ